jgi:hypothetical protein
MARTNGLQRTLKTIVRKTLGIDAMYRRELMRQLGLRGLHPTIIHRMDADQMTSGVVVRFRALPLAVPTPSGPRTSTRLQRRGELTGHDLDELLTHQLTIFWQKPL